MTFNGRPWISRLPGQWNQDARSSLASRRTYRALSLMRSTIPTVSILQLERVQPFLVIFRHRVRLISCFSNWGAVCPPLVGLLRDSRPFLFPKSLPCWSVVLLLIIIVGAIIKKLRIDFHKKLHGIVYHTVNCSISVSYVTHTFHYKVPTYSNVLWNSRRAGQTLSAE